MMPLNNDVQAIKMCGTNNEYFYVNERRIEKTIAMMK